MDRCRFALSGGSLTVRVGLILLVCAAIFGTEVESARRKKPILPVPESLISRGPASECPEKADPLKFHRIYKGRRITLINGGRTAVRSSPMSEHGLYGSLVTHRPLLDDELFEVQITETINYDKKGTLAIGVVTEPPRNLKDRKFLCCTMEQTGVWDAHANRIEKDGRIVNNSYPIRLRELPAGTHLGVMRKSNGDLHFFVNGLDRGVAASDVPQGVFGYFELIKYATVATVTC